MTEKKVERVAIAELLPRITFDTSRNKNATMLDWLAKSIGEIGLQHPIGVYRDADGVLQVVAGRHRVLAYAQLGKTEPTKYAEIEAVLLDDLSPLNRELWTIDENLRRADLNSFERDKLTAKRVELVVEKTIVSRPVPNNAAIRGFKPQMIPERGPRGGLKPAEKAQRNQAQKRGEEVPPAPTRARAAALKEEAATQGVHPRTIGKRITKLDPDKHEKMKRSGRLNTLCSDLYRVLTRNTKDWPEVKRRVEEKLGKTIVERIQELERGPAEVVEFTAAG